MMTLGAHKHFLISSNADTLRLFHSLRTRRLMEKSANDYTVVCSHWCLPRPLSNASIVNCCLGFSRILARGYIHRWFV